MQKKNLINKNATAYQVPENITALIEQRIYGLCLVQHISSEKEIFLSYGDGLQHYTFS